MVDSWQPHGLQHAWLPCLGSPMDCSTPDFHVLHCLPEFAQIHVHRVGDTIQLSQPVTPFSFCLQSFPASGSFPMSWLFASRDQSIGTSALESVILMNIQGWYPLGLTGLISLQSKGPSRVFSSALQFKSINSSALSLTYGPALASIPDYWKNHSFDYLDLCQKNDVSTLTVYRCKKFIFYKMMIVCVCSVS